MERLYLDYCATTPVRSEVLQEMMKVYETEFGNPSSLHEPGRRAKIILETARDTVAEALGAKPKEIIFTGSGTEANNLAIFGSLRRFMDAPGNDPIHVVTSSIEHPAVLECFQQLGRRGVQVTYLPVTRDGVVSLEDVREALQPNTKLVSVMLANNEVGTLQPVREIAALCRQNGTLMHTDAVQAVGKIPVSIPELGVDMLTYSAHKVYGPKGVGVLYANRRARLQQVTYGGDQERGLRPSTENIAVIHGAAVAISLAIAELDTEMNRLRTLRDEMTRRALDCIPDLRVTGGDAATLPHVVHFSVADVLGEALLLELDRIGIRVSSGAACSAGSTEPSHVLAAMKVPERFIHGALRVSLGRLCTDEDVKQFVDGLIFTIRQLRRLKTG